MIVKFLGALDIFIGGAFLLSEIFNIFSNSFIITLGLYLLIKGIIFATSLDATSFLDIACGGIILLSTLIIMPSLIVWLVTIFLVQKGIFSLF